MQVRSAARVEVSADRVLGALAGTHGCTAFFAGAGGCGMRGLASFLLEAGWKVTGADRSGLSENDPLVRAGLQPLAEHAAPPPVSLAVRSAAVPEGDAAFVAACAAGARPLLYAELLGEISRLRPVLAVAGSHGKTTCTGWIAWALRRAGVPVGYLVGAPVPQLGASAEWGDARLPLVVESCEYARSFHHLRPTEVALVNVDAEHPDTYPGGLPEVLQAFVEFLDHVPLDGRVHAGVEAPDLASACAGQWCPAPHLPAAWQVGLAGAHSRRNAALVAAVLSAFGLEESVVRAALADFKGAARRMEVLGSYRGATVVSDYAHHPVEVTATLQAAREQWPERRLVVVFQPHQAQRFHAYRELFAPSLDQADALLLLEVYRARDPATLHADVAELRPDLEMRRPGRPLGVARNLHEGAELLHPLLREHDVVLCLGAGDVDDFARSLR